MILNAPCISWPFRTKKCIFGVAKCARGTFAVIAKPDCMNTVNCSRFQFQFADWLLFQNFSDV